MEKADEYLFYWRDKGEMFETVYYYKNGKLHRDAGPAIASFSDIYKYKNLDSHLYKESLVPIFNPTISDFIQETSPDGNIIVKEEEIPLVYIDSCYYLDDKEYSKKAFRKLKSKKVLKTELEKELLQNNGTHHKKTKI